MLKTSRLVSPMVAIVMLAGCAKNNLLGTWDYVEGSSVMPVICKELVYTNDREICGSITQRVDYELVDNAVIVKPKEESGPLNLEVMYQIVSPDVIAFKEPVSGSLVYYQRQGTTQLTAEAIKYTTRYTPEQLEQSCANGPAQLEHRDKYWSEIAPKQIHTDICTAAKLMKGKL